MDTVKKMTRHTHTHNILEDFDLLHEHVVESEIEDGSDIELDDLLVVI